MIKKVTTGRYTGKYLVRTSIIDQNKKRRFSPRKYVDTLQEAKNVENEDRIAYARGYQALDSTMPLWQYFKQWYHENAEPYLETNSKSNYLNLISRLRNDLPKYSLKEFDGNKSAIQQYFNSLGQRFSSSTVRKYRAFLSKAFSDAEYNGLIKKTPMPSEHRIRTTGTDKGIYKPVTVLNINDAQKLRSFLYANISLIHQEYLMLLIMLECGLRPNEAKALEFNDLNRFNHTLHVHNNYIEADNTIKPYTKTRSDRHVPLSSDLEIVIASFIEQKQQRLSRYNIENDFNLMFRKVSSDNSSSDRLLSTSANTNKVLRAALKKVGIGQVTKDGGKITAKTLRATHDTILIQKGISLDYIARISGHTIEVIQKYYHGLLDEVAHKEADKVKSIWG